MTSAQQSALAALAVASQTLTATAAAVAEAERVLRFVMGSRVRWTFGDMTGEAEVVGGTVTIDGLPLTSGDAFKPLVIQA